MKVELSPESSDEENLQLSCKVIELPVEQTSMKGDKMAQRNGSKHKVLLHRRLLRCFPCTTGPTNELLDFEIIARHTFNASILRIYE
jgi:hypothetical protein